jgi:DNA polymerase-1
MKIFLSKNKILRKYFSVKENLAFKNLKSIPTVTIVRSIEQAKEVVSQLKVHKDRFHAWDTETLGIDPKEQSPVGNGRIICLSCFAGPDIDFGNGPSIRHLI